MSWDSDEISLQLNTMMSSGGGDSPPNLGTTVTTDTLEAVVGGGGGSSGGMTDTDADSGGARSRSNPNGGRRPLPAIPAVRVNREGETERERESLVLRCCRLRETASVSQREQIFTQLTGPPFLAHFFYRNCWEGRGEMPWTSWTMFLGKNG